jgi:hypothetical protein
LKSFVGAILLVDEYIELPIHNDVESIGRRACCKQLDILLDPTYLHGEEEILEMGRILDEVDISSDLEELEVPQEVSQVVYVTLLPCSLLLPQHLLKSLHPNTPPITPHRIISFKTSLLTDYYVGCECQLITTFVASVN